MTRLHYTTCHLERSNLSINGCHCSFLTVGHLSRYQAGNPSFIQIDASNVQPLAACHKIPKGLLIVNCQLDALERVVGLPLKGLPLNEEELIFSLAFLFTKGTSNTLKFANAELTALEAKDWSKQYGIISNNDKNGHLPVTDLRLNE